ncbi:class I SAM-dependent methyltransferase [Streptomyces sp. B6B3]|uniref:class I SAM-dependent methyltransferase n=1 Tax=Streptomyces sp. B6B3 TaxID=3153570 RepID=UPI00325DF412
MNEAWDVYAEDNRSKPERERNAAGETTWFNWTQYPDHGPGAELLGSPRSALDLGCGTGRNVAHLAFLGASAVGLDVSSIQISRARERFGATPRLSLVCREASEYLTAFDGEFDAICSVFGAVWFTDPAIIRPLIFKSLRPGGVLAFSQHPPIEGCYGCQGSYVYPKDGGKPAPLRRWAYTTDMWADLLASYSFSSCRGEIISAPPSGDVDTLLVTAYR